jgi:hypothetical protein
LLFDVSQHLNTEFQQLGHAFSELRADDQNIQYLA